MTSERGRERTLERRDTPTVPPPAPQGLAPVLQRNIQALCDRRRDEEAFASREERVAQAVTAFSGRMVFVYIHLFIFGVWILANAGLVSAIPRWDPTFVILGTAASVEAIFLSTFVLISQNRMAASADKRADLDLQISLLSEHEVTKLVTLVAAIAAKLDVRTEVDEDLQELKKDVAPEAVLDEIESSR